jgi:hypothetical protein
MAVNEVVIAGRRKLTTKDSGGQLFYAFADIKTVEDLKCNLASLRALNTDDKELQDYAIAVQSTVDEYTEANFQSIRSVLVNFMGQKVIDITQIDDSEWEEGDHPYITLMFENGSYLKMYSCGMGFEFFDAVTGLDMPLAMPMLEDFELDDETPE